MNVNKMAEKVMEFQEKIVHVGISPTGRLSDDRMHQRYNHMCEELSEMMEAYAAGSDHDVVDANVDLIYLALGTLLEMGVPPDFPFDTVHEANMKKVSTVSQRNGKYEAGKPPGWNPPDHGPLIERVAILNKVSPVFVELTKMREHKGKNYNRGTVKRSDHFPLGHLSFFTMVWLKSCRLRSLTESLLEDGCDRNKTTDLINRELGDLINYACFWAEWIRGIEI